MNCLKISEERMSAEKTDHQGEDHTTDQNPSPPHIHSSDKILVFGEEILVLPVDMEGEEDIEDVENVFYTKADSRRLERYLQQEAMSEWKRPEKKCAQHSVRCEVCEL